MVKQLLPIGNLAVFEYEFQGDIFEEKVFGHTKHGREALLLVFGHEDCQVLRLAVSNINTPKMSINAFLVI